MNIVVKSALAGAALIVAYACATPVDISDDVLPVDPNVFGDGGLPPAGDGGASGAAGGGGAGSGGSGVATGGTGAGVGGANAGSGMQAVAGSSGVSPIGTGGTGTGAGGAAALGGTGGASGGAAATAGTGGGAGTGAQGAFDPAACNFDDLTGCEDVTCLAGCAPNDGGGSCSTRCQTLITCVTTDPECTITEADPLCAARINGTATACTQEADAAGGADTTQTTQPAFVARQFVECLCSTPRL